MSEKEETKGQRASFKHEWNNFSIYCWSLMEKCLGTLSEEEREQFKRGVTDGATSLDKVRVVIENTAVMAYLKSHVEYLNGKNSVGRKKDSEYAYNCKRSGDIYFQKGRFQSALKFYAKAILFFDNDEDELGHESTVAESAVSASMDEMISLSTLYICRAKTLVKLERLNDAYSDFKQALILEPEIRSSGIEVDDLAMYYKPDKVDFRMTSSNAKLDGAADSVRMEHCEAKGRMICAERRIEEGEILFMEQPYVHWLRPTYYGMYCHQCLKKLAKHIYTPCDHCTEVRFCSGECKDAAWQRYHRTECKYLRLLRKWPSGHMALRLILKDGIEYAMQEDRKPAIPLSEYPKLGFRSDYSSIKSLTGENNFTDGDYYCPLIIGCVLIGLLFEMNNEIKSDDLEQFSALLIKSIMQILENTFMIYDYDIKAVDRDDFLEDEVKSDGVASSETKSDAVVSNEMRSNETKSDEAKSDESTSDQKANSQIRKFHQMSSTSYKIGVGLYSATSLIPHSCDNNANKYFFGSSILIVAGKPIEANDEVNIEYGVHYKMNTLKYRKDYLRNNFGFDCQCYACLAGYENVGLSFKCPKCRVGALIRNLDQTNHCLRCEAKNVDLAAVNGLIKRAEEHFRLGVEAYKQGNIKRSEAEFRAGEKICAKVYYNDVKLQFIKCELSHLYTLKKNFALAYQYLLDTLPVNRSLYGEASIEVLANHIELACLAIECIQHLTSVGFSMKQASQRLFRQLLQRMRSKSAGGKKRASETVAVEAFEELDRKLSNCDEVPKWKRIFMSHYQASVQLYTSIAKRDAKIACDESIASLNKLAQMNKFMKTIEG